MVDNELLDVTCEMNMNNVIAALKQNNGGVVRVDGAKSKMGKLLTNFIIHTRIPFFIEYLRSDLKRETTATS